MRPASSHGLWLPLLPLLIGCGDPVRSAGEASLGPIEQVVSGSARGVWPGAGQPALRQVRRQTAFFDGQVVAYWDGGAASRTTADVFWLCRRGADRCPFDRQGVLDPGSAVGDPVFARLPGEQGYSPYWLVWVVWVPEDYRPNQLKSVLGIQQAAAEGQVEVAPLIFDHGGAVGPDSAVMNCLLVLAGTELEGNGAPTPDGTPSLQIERRQGWHKRYRVHYFDFTPGEGVIPPDGASESRPQMPASDLFVLRRDCAASASAACVGGSGVLIEQELGADLDGDGDLSATNNLLAGYPGRPSSEGRPYTALWRRWEVQVTAAHDEEVALIDRPGGSALRSADQMRALIERGWLEAPFLAHEGPRGEVLFSGPVQVRAR